MPAEAPEVACGQLVLHWLAARGGHDLARRAPGARERSELGLEQSNVLRAEGDAVVLRGLGSEG